MKEKVYLNKTMIRKDFLRDIVTNMVEKRQKLGLTQEELNGRLGVADRLVSKWECGMQSPTAFNLYCWAFALGMRLTVASNDNVPPKNLAPKFKADNDNRFMIVRDK